MALCNRQVFIRVSCDPTLPSRNVNMHREEKSEGKEKEQKELSSEVKKHRQMQ